MAYNKFQTGGKDRQWLFDPQMIETIAPILSKLVTYDEYFKEEQGTTTLMIVLDKILEELPPEFVMMAAWPLITKPVKTPIVINSFFIINTPLSNG